MNPAVVTADRDRHLLAEKLRVCEEELRHLRHESELRMARLEELNRRLGAEVEERKLAEAALQESERRFRAIFERAGLGIVLLDRQGIIRQGNWAFQRMLGLSSETLRGRALFDFVDADDIEPGRLALDETVQGKVDSRHAELRFRRADGIVRWGRQITSAVLGLRGELQFLIAMVEDITDEKARQAALLESETRFRQIADMAGEWLWERNVDGIFTYSSSAVTEILGYDPSEAVGRHFQAFFATNRRGHFVYTAEHVGAPEAPFRHTINHYRHKDGREVYTESTGQPIFDAQGRLVKWRGVDHDVTERKRFEDALRLRDRAIEAARGGILISDPRQPHHPVIYANPAACKMTGYSPAEIIGKNPEILCGPDTDPAAIAQMRECLKQDQHCHLTLKNYRKDGSYFWNDLLVSPVLDELGRLTHYIGILTDVTQLRQAQEERRDLELARQIQMSLLPAGPLHGDGYRVAGHCLPAALVGGDYFDYFRLGETVHLLIADVSGHSVGAALMMTELRIAMHMECRRPGSGPHPPAGEILHRLNDLLYDDLNRVSYFITMAYFQYQAGSGRLSYAMAGHMPPILMRGDTGDIEQLDADGLVLGVKKRVAFETRTLRLRGGDTLLLYTDGVTDAQNERGEFFGIPALVGVLRARSWNDPEALNQAVGQALESFSLGKSYADDISLVTLQVP